MAKNLGNSNIVGNQRKVYLDAFQPQGPFFFDSEFKDLIPPCGLGTRSISITWNLVRNAESFLPTTAASESIV